MFFISLADWVAIVLPGPNVHSLLGQLIGWVRITQLTIVQFIVLNKDAGNNGHLYVHWDLPSFLSYGHYFGSAIVVRLSWISFRDNSHGHVCKYNNDA